MTLYGKLSLRALASVALFGLMALPVSAQIRHDKVWIDNGAGKWLQIKTNTASSATYTFPTPGTGALSSDASGNLTLGTLSASNGGTGLSSYGAGNYILLMNGAGSALSYALLANANVAANAAIAGTKINPDFGTQNVTTSGDISTTGSGNITAGGLLTANGGLTVTGTVTLPAGALASTSINLPDGKILVGDNTGHGAAVALSGDATMDDAGVLTLANSSSARSDLGLGSIATQDASNVAISGGAIDGTPIGATTPSTGAFTNLTATGTVTLPSGSVTLSSLSVADGKMIVGNASNQAAAVNMSGDATIDNTGAVTLTNSAGARSDLGLGSIATQAANNVSITGGAIDGTPIGATTPSTGSFTNLTATGTVNLPSLTTSGKTVLGYHQDDPGTGAATLTIGNYTVEDILANAGTTSLSITLPSGTNGQLLYVRNSNAQDADVNSGSSSIPSGATATYLYVNGTWTQNGVN